jgi:60S ribosome subunit biogenesis protein NIP7
MRPLTDAETKLVFEKLAKYIGGKLKFLIEREDKVYVFRLHRNRVFYCDENLLKYAGHFEKKKLVSFGTCIGKFTKTSKFRIHISALGLISKFAKYKVWVKPGGEQSFLYGNHILKTHVARITEDAPQYSGICVYNINDLPLGFGTTGKGTLQIKEADPHSTIVFNQSDVGKKNYDFFTYFSFF